MSLLDTYKKTRNRFLEISASLEPEDCSVQPVEYVSPPKWHLAHTTWFFEQFVLVKYSENYKVFDEDFAYLFNSYYNNAGTRILRPNRGLMTRPTMKEVIKFRAFVDEKMGQFLNGNPSEEAKEVLQLGLMHEQQHQELFYYDIKYILGNQPTFPIVEHKLTFSEINSSPEFLKFDEGIYQIGYKGDGFCFDNELGQHKVYLQKFEICDQLVTNKEYIEFIDAGGYSNFNYWHAEGWDFIQSKNIKAPKYWHKVKEEWHAYTLSGFKSLQPNLPVQHLSFFEASAYAEWKQLRLPTEFEWEVASSKLNWGQLWEWTNSAYLPYPGYSKVPGALGEYNGKFMVNQMVLRGASIATFDDHSRHTYRNFFHTDERWMFSGIRLAK
ncbi:ergothioneine biosynthesis protein EgtB [Ulvibacter antarcticus]|uniref:Ergothioneine biosynthesis protein EgtB n=1 Tax=Ulvibacter antarcticus TaxID=442714 RepID=A0A3L9YX38_9FLAO|nr:ergothioneine biosynthesis protein EgtB [Ulvibacter antarcticus]RMA64397.1 ergothioneine biosynthesis protein EgtB [Ulvibacter antarcticus]